MLGDVIDKDRAGPLDRGLEGHVVLVRPGRYAAMCAITGSGSWTVMAPGNSIVSTRLKSLPGHSTQESPYSSPITIAEFT